MTTTVAGRRPLGAIAVLTMACALAATASCSGRRPVALCDRLVDRLRIGGRVFTAVSPVASIKNTALVETVVTPGDLGDEVGSVALAAAPCSPLTDGAAYVLAPGSSVRTIVGVPSWFRLGVVVPAEADPAGGPTATAAAEAAPTVRVYEREVGSASASTPDEFVDLSRTNSIEARDTRGRQREITDPALVARFVSLVRAGKVSPRREPDFPMWIVELRLGQALGPPIVMHYWSDRSAIDDVKVPATPLRKVLGIGADFG